MHFLPTFSYLTYHVIFQACSQAEHDVIDELIDLDGKPRCASEMDKNIVQSKACFSV